MERKATVALLIILIAVFAVVLTLFIRTLLVQQWEMNQNINDLKELVDKTMAGRTNAEKLAAELKVKEEEYKKRLEEFDALLRALQEEEKAFVEKQLTTGPPAPDSKKVEELAAEDIPELVSKLQSSINASDHTMTSALIAALKKKGPQAVDFLIEHASKPESDTKKYYYILILALLKDKKALPIFQDAMNPEESIVVRNAAVTGLMTIPDISSLQLLIRTLDAEKDRGIKIKIVTALGIIGDSRAVESLKKIFNEEDDYTLRNFALTAIARIADPLSVDFFGVIARDSEKEGPRFIAVVGLKNIGTTAAKSVLKEIAKTEGAVAEEARKALEEITGNKGAVKKESVNK